MIGSSTGSIFLAFLAVFSVSPALAAPQGSSVRKAHYPYKDYHSESSPKHQNSNTLASVVPCELSPGELPAKGDQEFVFDGTRYSQLCLDRAGFAMVPEERTDCRTECPTCLSVRGYDMPCIAERVLQRSAEGDLNQFRDVRQPTTRMTPTDRTNCLASPGESLPTPSGNWSPFTLAGANTFDNDCLTRLYLNSLSPTASCLPNDNACMIDRALELGNSVEDPAAPGVPLDVPPVDGFPLGPSVPDPNL